VAREGRVDEAIRCRQLRSNAIRRTTETDALLSVEDADSPWTFSDLVEPSPFVSTSDVPFVTRRHTRVDHPIVARCAFRNRPFVEGDWELTCEPEDPASPYR
jgi:hypothetical protein